MNDIEKQIEDSFKDDNIIKEEDIINKRLNHRNNNNNKKVLLYTILIFIVVVIIGIIIYLMLNKKEDIETPKDNDKEEITIKEEEIPSNKGYVLCNDNTALLNVRNSTTGDIIDGLSCYQTVTIEEELDKTENCDKWYKVTYKKHNNNYTGYVCSDYIKKLEVKESVINDIKEVIDKTISYYDTTRLMPFCGDTSASKKVKFKENDTSSPPEGEYLKSEFKDLEEVKNYLLEFMSESLIDTTTLKLSDYNNPQMNDDYYMIDNNLYCRGYAAKYYNSLYTNNYNIEVTNNTDSKININIAYEYIKEDTISKENNKCTTKDLSSCKNSDFEYTIGKITIDKINNKYIISKIDYHD